MEQKIILHHHRLIELCVYAAVAAIVFFAVLFISGTLHLPPDPGAEALPIARP